MLGPIGKFFGKVLGFFKKIFSPRQLKNFGHVLDQIDKVVPMAFDVVQTLADLTPTRADDEILAAARQFGFGGPLNLDSKENALRDLARFILQKTLRERITDSVANAALELAVSALKAAREA